MEATLMGYAIGAVVVFVIWYYLIQFSTKAEEKISLMKKQNALLMMLVEKQGFNKDQIDEYITKQQ